MPPQGTFREPQSGHEGTLRERRETGCQPDGRGRVGRARQKGRPSLRGYGRGHEASRGWVGARHIAWHEGALVREDFSEHPKRSATWVPGEDEQPVAAIRSRRPLAIDTHHQVLVTVTIEIRASVFRNAHPPSVALHDEARIETIVHRRLQPDAGAGR